MTGRGTAGAMGSAREIAPDVFCLGPRGPTQTNVYFVGSAASWTLVDAGWAKDGWAIRKAGQDVFGADSPASGIVLTHVHPDHSGSARELARAWNCPVYVHPDELGQANGDFDALRAGAGPVDLWLVLPLLRALGQRRREAILAKSSLRGVARAFDPSASMPDLPGWECIPTPGHTPGHTSFFRRSDRVLISGDAVVTLKLNSVSGLALGRQGLAGPPRYTSWNWRAARASIARLCQCEPLVLAGGHGLPIMGPDVPRALRDFSDRWR